MDPCAPHSEVLFAGILEEEQTERMGRDATDGPRWSLDAGLVKRRGIPKTLTVRRGKGAKRSGSEFVSQRRGVSQSIDEQGRPWK